MQRIKLGDYVRVISGDSNIYGKEGRIIKVCPKQQKAIVEGVNKVKKHLKPSNNNKGEIKEKEMWLPWAKLALINKKATRGIDKVKFVLDKKGKKVRFFKRTNTIVEVAKK